MLGWGQREKEMMNLRSRISELEETVFLLQREVAGIPNDHDAVINPEQYLAIVHPEKSCCLMGLRGFVGLYAMDVKERQKYVDKFRKRMKEAERENEGEDILLRLRKTLYFKR